VIRSGKTYLEIGQDSREKSKIIPGISLISIHRCISYDIWVIIMNMKYDDLM